MAAKDPFKETRRYRKHREGYKPTYKWCSDCETVKPISEFYKRKENWDGYFHICKACMYKRKMKVNHKHQAERRREKLKEQGATKVCKKCGEEKPVEHFGNNSKKRDGLSDICKECVTAAARATRQKKLERQEQERLYLIDREITLRAGRNNFFNFCQILAPDFFKASRWHLWLLCNTLQALYERHLTKNYFWKLCTMPHIPKWVAESIDWDRLHDGKPYTKLMINMSPRSGKTRSLTMFEQWLLGKSKDNRIITVSYNTDLASNISRYVRDGIMQQKNIPTDIVFSDIFPNCRISKGNAGFMKWALEGSFFNYMGTGMEGSLTGSGANCLAGDTEIITDKGKVLLENIFGHEENYNVLTFNEKEGRLEFKKILASRKIKKQPVMMLTFEVDSQEGYGDKVICTPEHRFFVRKCRYEMGEWEKPINFSDFQWIEAKDICCGDWVLNSDFEIYEIDDTLEDVGKDDVYDLQIEDNHNFFANDILTHNCIICDDLIKNAQEAYNERVLDDIWNWYTGTLMSRAEHTGEGSIEIINFTRWSTKDLCGRILESPMSKDWANLIIPVEHDGELYCEEILPKDAFERLREGMDTNIFEANYYQKPLDVEGRLFSDLKTYDFLPEGTEKFIAYCDTADEGSDYLACICGAVYQGEGYITDIYYTQETMQVTEPKTAELLVKNTINHAKIESNNGGKGFARNVEQIIWDKYHTRQVNIEWFHQTENKMARILTGSTFIQNHVYFPKKWDKRWPDFYKHVMGFSKDGKNKHDDGVEALVEWGKMITGDGSVNSYIEWMKRMQEGRA